MTGPVIDQLRRRMRDLDAELVDRAGPPASLAPGRSRATSLEALTVVIAGDFDSRWAQALAGGVGSMVRSQIEHFPGNIYWDLDFLVAALLGQAGSPTAFLDLAERVVRLQRLFGCHSVIGFRYLHDFTYGFDWARWTARSPGERATIGPFSGTFLDRLEHRGGEIEARIRAGDARYPRLAPGVFRNPFPFSRSPRDERRLLEDLAANDLIPVHAWRVDARPRFDRPYTEQREVRARELGIPSSGEADA